MQLEGRTFKFVI